MMQTADEYLKDNEFIANEHGQFIYKSGNDEVNLKHILCEYAKLYASEKVKEALKLAAERATCSDVSWTAMPEYEVDAESILSLETEILNQINKEI